MSEYIDPYLDYLRLVRRSANTIKSRGKFLHRVDAKLPCGLDAASSEELHEVIYRPTYADWTLCTYYFHLAGFFEWASDPRSLIEYLDFNPVTYIERPRTPDCLPNPVSDDQLAAMLDHFTGHLRQAIVLAAYAGMRCVEITRADREHFTADNITIPRGKGDRPGIVPAHPLIWEMVKGLPPGPVIRTAAGARWSEHALSVQACRVFSRLLDEKAGLHRLRHWYGTTIYRQTRDPERTRVLMRHRNPKSTLGYILIADGERAEAISALPVLTPAGR